MDANLRRKDIWETPRNIGILAGAAAVIAAAVGGYLGYEIARTPSPPPVVIYVMPAPAPAAK